MRRDRSLPLLAILLIVAALLRGHRLGDELWIDEILTQQRVTRLGLAQIATTYESQNQHVLYSLLARIAIDLFGDTPAALRVPAAIFGVLSIAATYGLGRALLSRREALLGAALLAVSDLHVWFSQNARGYTALLFFTLLSSLLLLDALAHDRRRGWVLYGVVGALGLYVHLTMLFVLAGHAVLVAQRCLRGGGEDAALRRSLLRGALAGFAVAAALTALLYAPIVRDLLAITAVEGRDGANPEWSSPRWALLEAVTRVLGSFPRPWLALPAAAAGLAGLWSVARRAPLLVELLVLPVAVGLVVVIGSGHTAWPRLFFFASGFAALVAASGALTLGERLARRCGAAEPVVARAGGAGGLLLLAAVATGLPGAYGPKQRFVEAVALVERLAQPGDAVATSGPASVVLRGAFGRDWPRVDSAQELSVIRGAAQHTWFVNTFPQQLRARRPDLIRMLEEEFEPVARLGGTLRGGEILVWRTRSPDGGFAGPSS